MLLIENLSFSYQKPIFKNLNLSLPDTGLVGIIGTSGIGKSTLLYLISNILQPDTGKITYHDKSISLKDISFMTQDYDLIDHLTIKDNILLGCQSIHKSYSLSQYRYLLKTLHIDYLENRYPYQISIGQRKRVSLVRTLLRSTPIILLDEPTGSLSKHLKTKVYTLLKEYSKTHLLLVVTHDKQEQDYFDTILSLPVGTLSKHISHQDIQYTSSNKHYSFINYTLSLFQSKIKQYLFILSFLYILIILLSSLTIILHSIQISVDDYKNHAVRKNIITLDHPYKDSQPALLYDLGTCNIDANLYTLPQDTKHIQLKKGYLPKKETDILITESLSKYKDITYTLDKTYHLHVTGIIKDTILNDKDIYFSRIFYQKHQDDINPYVYEYEDNNSIKLYQKHKGIHDVYMKYEEYKDVMQIGRMILLIFMIISILSGIIFITLQYSDIYEKRKKECTILQLLSLSHKDLYKIECMIQIMILCLSLLCLPMTYMLVYIINHYTSFITLYHFTLIIPIKMISIYIGLFILLLVLSLYLYHPLTSHQLYLSLKENHIC